MPKTDFPGGWPAVLGLAIQGIGSLTNINALFIGGAFIWFGAVAYHAWRNYARD